MPFNLSARKHADRHEKKDTNLIVLLTEADLSAESGWKLLKVIRSWSKDHVNLVNPVRFFIVENNSRVSKKEGIL